MKFAAAWAFVTARALPFVIAGVFGLMVLAGVERCSANNLREENGRLKGALQIDSVSNDSLRQQLAIDSVKSQKDSTYDAAALAGWNRATIRDALPPLPKTATAHDTITRVATQLKACRDAGDTLATAITVLQSSCSQYRADAAKRILGLERAYAHLDTLNKIGRPAKRFGFGIFAGYGLHNDAQSFDLKRGLVAGVGFSYSIIQW